MCLCVCIYIYILYIYILPEIYNCRMLNIICFFNLKKNFIQIDFYSIFVNKMQLAHFTIFTLAYVAQ